MSLKKKLVSIGASVLLCFLFVYFTSHKYKTLTGHWQYSPFSGWQWANNAMYCYRYVNKSDHKPVPEKFKSLDKMVLAYFDSTKDTEKYPEEAIMASSYYMWSKGMPLMKYQDKVFSNQDSVSEIKKWATMGPLYRAYGLYIIKQYPQYFLKYFIWPNFNKYYAPPLEFLESYNSGKDTVIQLAQFWFGYKDNKLKTRITDKEITVIAYYPIFSGVINLMVFCCMTCYIILKGWKFNQRLNKVVLLGGALWILNAVFTITASPAALRFQTFPIIVSTVLVAILLDWMIHLARTNVENSLLWQVSQRQSPDNPNIF
jgi:hypothetical protein